MIEGLTTAWAEAVAEAGCQADQEQVAAQGHRLLGRWSEPHRRYHDLRHLRAVLDGLDLLTAPDPAPASTRLAAWFHDAVYDGRPGADEQASAHLARQVLAELGAPAALADEVARLVLATADHVVADDDAGAALLVDADLAILAAPAAVYASYARAVRAEYAHIPDAGFAAGRRAVLVALLDREQLYRTPRGARLWEAAARANLAAELARLDTPSPEAPDPRPSGRIPGAATPNRQNPHP